VSDPRILELCRTTQRYREGNFQAGPAVDGEDEVARLAEALHGLAGTLESSFEKIRLLGRVTQQVNSGRLLDEVLDQVYEWFRPLIPYDRIGLTLLEEGGRTVRARWERSDLAASPFPADYSLPLAESSLGTLLEQGHPRILNNLEDYLQERPTSDSTRRLVEVGVRSSLTCPLVALGRPVGFLFFSSCRPDVYRRAHVEVFIQIAGQVSVILEKARLYQEIAELNHLKDRFLDLAAHDLRSPLVFLKGYLELLREGYMGEVSGSQGEVFLKMQALCRSMLALLNDLLGLQALRSDRLCSTLVPEDCRLLLQECAAVGGMLANRKGVHLRLEAPEDLPALVCDREHLAQALNNLVSNAVKFSLPETEILLRAAVDGEFLVVEVADQGVGIPEEDMPTLFSYVRRPSVRPTGDEMSTGLGLPLVRRIIEAHGGTVRATSVQGRGSTFTLRLPLAGPPGQTGKPV